uniref:Uncharacterized protein n=1 Tax=Tanacetum cinerariifolium TaxID=118510 RepID=A0A6L2MPX1_TANCI|nr:hypothetical protein [Tanacetum cinerariifolium]
MYHSKPNFAKIPILDTKNFEQWKLRIQQYLQNEHYALWEVIEFGDSYKAPPEETGKGPASESSAKKKGRTVAITTKDMQKRRNDVKERTTLFLALPDEHQLRYSKYETAKELWEAILKIFGGNETTKKTKKNQLKMQYGNFKAEGSETLEQTFNRLQAIVSHLEFMDVEIEQDDLNQKFLTSLAPKWLMIETTDQETKIIATVDGKPLTISESSLRRHLKLNDEEGISSLPDAELFENLSLMGYNILPNQRNIATIVVCLAINRVYNFSKMIFDGMGEGSANPTEPHHTPSPQEHHSPQHDSPPLSHQAPTETLTPRRFTRRAIRIAQSKALSPAADEPASLSRDDRECEAFPTISSLDARQDMENIAKTSTMPHESSPRVPSLDADKGSMQQRILELIELCTSLVKSLEDKERRRAEPTQEYAPITGGIKDLGEELGAYKSAAAGVSPADVLPTASVPTVSGSFPTVSAIFTTASVVTPYTRRSRCITIGSLQPMRIPIISPKDKGKEKENQRLSEQVVRDSEIARIHTEKELKMMIEGLDMSNEVIAKHLSKYEQAEADLSVGEKIELISELVKYQDHRAKILKYQAQQRKPLSKKEQREFYMSVLRSHAGWKTKHFRGMTLEQIKEKFIPVWKQLEDFVPMSSKEESERVKRPGLKLDQGSSKRVKISHTSGSKPSQEQQFKGFKGVSKEELKGMMQLVPLEEVYIEALQQFDRQDLHQLWILVKETFSIKQPTSDKEKELWVELKRLFEPDSEDQLWTHHQAFMHDPLD